VERAHGVRRKEQAALFAHCASSAVNALYEPANRYNEGRVSANGIRRSSITPTFLPAPSASTWQQWLEADRRQLSRPVTKPRILEAVREVKASNRCSSSTTSRKATWRGSRETARGDRLVA